MIKYLFCFIILLGSISALAQQPNNNPCNNAELHNSLISINNANQKLGKKLEFTSDLQMPNRAFIPTAVNIAGTQCTINFLSDTRAKRCKITVLDDGNNVVFKEKFSGGTKSFSFKTRKGSKYIFVFSQKIKGKGDGCAAVSILSQ